MLQRFSGNPHFEKHSVYSASAKQSHALFYKNKTKYFLFVKQDSFSFWAQQGLSTQMLSCVKLFATPVNVAHRAPLSMRFPKQEYWRGLPFPPPVDLPILGTEITSHMSPALVRGFFFFLLASPGSPLRTKSLTISMSEGVTWAVQHGIDNQTHQIIKPCYNTVSLSGSCIQDVESIFF